MTLFCCCCCNNTSFLWWLTTTTFASASLHWNALWVDSRIMGCVADFLCCFEWSTSWVGKICKKNNLFNYQSKISCFFQIPSSFFPMLGSVLSIWDFLGTYIIIVFFSLKNLILFISMSQIIAYLIISDLDQLILNRCIKWNNGLTQINSLCFF